MKYPTLHKLCNLAMLTFLGLGIASVPIMIGYFIWAIFANGNYLAAPVIGLVGMALAVCVVFFAVMDYILPR